MKKIIIILIIASIFLASCSNNQIEQPASDNINSKVNINEKALHLTPTPIISNDISIPTPISNNASSQDTSIQKTNKEDNFVSTSFSNTTDEYSYSIPKIDINSDDVKAINKEIQDEYQAEIDEEIAYYQQGLIVDLHSVQYDTYLNGTILSLFISSEYDGDFNYYKIYNVDVSTGKYVSNAQLLQYINITESDFLNKLPKLYSDEFIEEHGSIDADIENMQTATTESSEEEIADFNEFYTDQYNLTIDKSNYGMDIPMFLDTDGSLNIIAKIYSIAGSDFYYHIINVGK